MSYTVKLDENSADTLVLALLKQDLKIAEELGKSYMTYEEDKKYNKQIIKALKKVIAHYSVPE